MQLINLTGYVSNAKRNFDYIKLNNDKGIFGRGYSEGNLSFIMHEIRRKPYLNNEYILDIIGALHQRESKKQINADIKQLEKVINKLRLTGTFAKGDTKKELNTYIKSLQSQLAHIKLAAKIDSRNLKSEVDKALRNVSLKDIDALNIDVAPLSA